jgi:hypothetical protein
MMCEGRLRTSERNARYRSLQRAGIQMIRGECPVLVSGSPPWSRIRYGVWRLKTGRGDG